MSGAVVGVMAAQKVAGGTLVTIGQNTGDTFSGFAEVELNSFSPTSNNNASGAVNVQADASFPNNGLFKCSGLSNLSGHTIQSGSLRLYLTSENSFPVVTMTMRRVLRNWVDSQATWNIFATASNWGTAGCLNNSTDRNATSVGGGSCGNGTGIYYDFPIDTAELQFMVDNPGSNFGWVMEHTTAGEWKNFIASDGANGTRPFLRVTYGP